MVACAAASIGGGMSIPLWITRMRAGSTPSYAATSSRTAAAFATIASARARVARSSSRSSRSNARLWSLRLRRPATRTGTGEGPGQRREGVPWNSHASTMSNRPARMRAVRRVTEPAGTWTDRRMARAQSRTRTGIPAASTTSASASATRQQHELGPEPVARQALGQRDHLALAAADVERGVEVGHADSAVAVCLSTHQRRTLDWTEPIALTRTSIGSRTPRSAAIAR